MAEVLIMGAAEHRRTTVVVAAVDIKAAEAVGDSTAEAEAVADPMAEVAAEVVTPHPAAATEAIAKQLVRK
jgi:hypothetical protein